MSKRALVIGSDRDYCYVIKEFLELRELYTTVVLNYKDGLDRLFYEKPDLSVLELIDQELSPALLTSLKASNDFETVDFAAGGAPAPGRKPILIFDDKNRITSLFDFIKQNYSGKPPVKEPANTENEGSLGPTFFPCILADIYEKKKTGVLSVKSNSNLEIYFTNGVPTFAEGGDVETAIGRMLLDRGKIDRESYEKAINISSSTNQKFGEVLFGMGITSPHELNSYLELQIEEKILRGFYYLQGRYEFRSGSNSPGGSVSYHLSLPRLVYEGIKRYVDVEDLEDRNPAVEVKPRLKSEVNNLGLKPKELRFVQLLKPRAYLKEILEASRLEKDETLKLLYFLSLFRLVSIPGLAVERVGRASLEKRLGEMEAERAEAGYSTDIAAAEISESVPAAEEAQEAFRELSLGPEAGQEEKVWEIGVEHSPEDGGEAEDDFSLTLEDSPAQGNEIGFPAEEEEGLSLDIGRGDGDPGETKEEDPLSGIEDLLLDKPAFSETPSEEASGTWKPFQNDESPMPWEVEDDEISIEPISPAEPISLESDPSEEEAESSFSFPSGPAEEESEIDLSESPASESAAPWKAGTQEESEETEIIEESEKEEKVWEIELDLGSPEAAEESGGGEESKTEEGFGGTFHLETEETGASAGQPWEVEAETPSEPVDSTPQSPFQSSVEPDSEPELVLDFDRDAARDELEEEEENPADLPLEHNWGLPDKSAGDVFTERVNEFYEGIESKDHYQILGIEKGSSGEQIRDAYYKLVKNYHPDVNPNADHEIRIKAEEIFTRITSAYETLSQSDKRQEYDSHEELAELKNQAKYIYEAEMAFKKGITLLIQRDYVEAEKKIREAILMNPDESAYIGAHGWARYLATENKPEVFGESVKALEKAIKINGKIPENHYYLGCVYKNQNDLKNAEKYFQKAIELEPDYIEAKRELRLINARKSSARTEKKPEKKFWSSLFKR